jgi:uncharacterized protein involved in cysteine biosynthesis
MNVAILGWILIVIGVIATGAGVAGGIATMFKEIVRKANEDKDYGFDALPTEFLKALTEFLKALAAAPVWLALVIIGFALIAWGGTMI